MSAGICGCSRGDIVYHLGDFAYKAKKPVDFYSRQLNGRKFLLFGNHDVSVIPEGFEEIQSVQEIQHPDEKLPIVLCHYAMRTWNRSHYGALHLFGHSHGVLPNTTQSCDVGVDCWDYWPVSLKEIKARMCRSAPPPKPFTKADFVELDAAKSLTLGERS